MNTPAHILISAIQTCEPAKVAEAIAQLNAQADASVAHIDKADRAWERERINPVRMSMPDMAGLTPLHVAAKAYSAHVHQPKLAAAFNAMVQLLLDAGASPWAAIGASAKDPGQTVVQVCQGQVPPSLLGWLAATVADYSTEDRKDLGEAVGRKKAGHDWVEVHSTTRARLAREARARREAHKASGRKAPGERKPRRAWTSPHFTCA